MMTLKTNQGVKFLYNPFMEYYKVNVIKRRLIVSGCPQQNEVTKRKNNIIIKMTRSMLKGKGIPNLYWV